MRWLRCGKLHPAVTHPTVEPNVHLQVLRLTCREEPQLSHGRTNARTQSRDHRHLLTSRLIGRLCFPVVEVMQRLLQDAERSALSD